MNHIKIFDKTAPILKGTYDVIVAPTNDYLVVPKVHETITYLFYEHRDLLKETQKILSSNTTIKGGDAFLISVEEGVKPYLMYAVLPLASPNHSEKQLKRFYWSVFEKALEKKLTSLRIPSIGEGIYGYSPTEVVEIGIEAALQFSQLDSVSFYCYNDNYYQLFSNALNQLS